MKRCANCAEFILLCPFGALFWGGLFVFVVVVGGGGGGGGGGGFVFVFVFSTVWPMVI